MAGTRDVPAGKNAESCVNSTTGRPALDKIFAPAEGISRARSNERGYGWR
jgi:hypothetical protein